MKCAESTLRLYAVTDRAWTGNRTLAEQVEDALRGGATCVQLREKQMEGAAFLAEAREICALCRRYGVPFLVNDNLDIALACGADGVHLGQDDMTIAEARRRTGEAFLIGATAHTVEEAVEAEREGADYLGCGAVFGSATKTDASAMTFETLQRICRTVSIPVAAIGGVTLQNLPLLAGSGAAGVAVVSALFAAPDICEAAKALRAASEEMARNSVQPG